jgi:hypothetical protein
VIDAIVTHHTDGFRSGVARFNELLAEHLQVPLLSLRDPLDEVDRPLLSFKVSELDGISAARVAALSGTWDVYLHEFRGLPLENQLVRKARRVLCGNLEIRAAVESLNETIEDVWTPGLILDDRAFVEADVTVFSFGMAHKIRTDMFSRLKDLLDRSGRTYSVYVSAANHETASLRDAEVVFAEMHRLFPDSLWFLGNLSDVAITNQLRRATFFAAFFPSGVRANNTSVAAAMQLGAVVITNVDSYSPPEFVHMENIVDIEACSALPSDPAVLERLSRGAIATSRLRTWRHLADRLAATS